ncbi:class I adenylate-forming enzyme family protein [Kurthia massiliensis]|uniref:class I adenylate-forming enzyme family protein n=1 Tax=Kurthia massiliensis TaxID=1033739 RepID=UPI000288E1B8|nr:class I adenylate-forming enzyme family protein [Kurthia massiliensis]
MNTSEILARNARKYPTHEALIYEDQRLTYAALDEYVTNLAHSLAALGIGYRDPVVLFMPNSIEFAVSYFAIQRAGSIVIPISAHATKYEIEHIIAHSQAKALIVHDLLYPIVGEINGVICLKTGDKAGHFESMRYLMSHQQGSRQALPSLNEDDLASILYTSGTTSQPKGVLFNYRSLLAMTHMVAIEMELKPDSKPIIAMPMSHAASLHLFFISSMMIGAPVVIMQEFSAVKMLALIQHERTTHFFGVPFYYLMLARSEKLPYTDLSTMIWWVYGGAPMSREEVQFVMDKMNTQRLVGFYGLTETGPSGSILFPDVHDHGAGSIGNHAPYGSELRVVNEQGLDTQPGEVGEIWIKGATNMVGYINADEENDHIFDNGWLKTGDLAKRDDDGFVWIVDRKNDIIITAGQIVYSREVEEILIQMDGIHEVAVVGVPHPEFGEIVKAFYAADNHIDATVLGDYANEYLATYKVPRRYERLDVLPRNISGKVLKQELKND